MFPCELACQATFVSISFRYTPSIIGISAIDTLLSGFTLTQSAHEYRVSSGKLVFAYMKPNWDKEQGKESPGLDNLRRRHMHKHTLYFSLHTHPSESPALLPPLVSVSLEKKKEFKNHSSLCRLRFSPVAPSFSRCLPLLYDTPASCRCLCTEPGLHIATRGLSNGSPLIFLSCPLLLLSLLTSLHCSSSQLSFPAVCLSTASPSSSFSFLPPLSHFCLPAPLSLVSLF